VFLWIFYHIASSGLVGRWLHESSAKVYHPRTMSVHFVNMTTTDQITAGSSIINGLLNGTAANYCTVVIIQPITSHRHCCLLQHHCLPQRCCLLRHRRLLCFCLLRCCCLSRHYCLLFFNGIATYYSQVTFHAAVTTACHCNLAIIMSQRRATFEIAIFHDGQLER
jgi:hypothetical protein